MLYDDRMARERKPSAIDFSSFERYAPWTDLHVLKDISAKPLRKSLRVNTLKISVDDFVAAAKGRGWELASVPWCPEGFFIDREDRSKALGRDLLHQVGCFYMQEAASMLPPALLGTKPGDAVLDMSAAPGSKTTQVAAALQGMGVPSASLGVTRGVIVANDVQENRLWTLKSNVHRLGATNVVITKKVGQWFAKHMTERFDRVLCDAPCTAQGTVRKDSDALRYCGLENIEKMARLQVQLLEAAIHAAKVGGTVVYSTCTLTPEENEGVVLQILKTFGDRVTVEKPEGEWAEKPIADSIVVQKTIDPDAAHPMLRLWPQTLDTEGFFSVVLKKHATTKEPEEMEWVKFQEEPLPSRRIREAMEHFTELYGTPVLRDGETLFQLGENVLLTTTDVVRFGLPLQDFSLGLPFAKLLKDGRVRIAHEMATLRGHEATKGTLTLSETQLADILDGKDTICDPSIRGDVLLLAEGRCIGRGLAKEGVLKNNLPRLMIQQS